MYISFISNLYFFSFTKIRCACLVGAADVVGAGGLNVADEITVGGF